MIIVSQNNSKTKRKIQCLLVFHWLIMAKHRNLWVVIILQGALIKRESTVRRTKILHEISKATDLLTFFFTEKTKLDDKAFHKASISPEHQLPDQAQNINRLTKKESLIKTTTDACGNDLQGKIHNRHVILVDSTSKLTTNKNH